jgi:hypothetical protein
MKNMFIRAIGGGMLLSALFVVSSWANEIDLTSYGSQPGDNGKGTIETWIASLVSTYDKLPSPDLPAPGSELFRVNQTGGNTGTVPSSGGYPTSIGSGVLSITIPTGGYDYIAMHWGGPGGGKIQAFYVGDIGGAVPSTITFKAPSKYGLSWYDAFDKVTTTVPDGGGTLVLLGTALSGLGLLRRKLG